MNEEPIISPGVLKVLGVILVAAVLGGGAYALAKGGIDLPDIDLDTTTGDVTTLENTNLEDTTIGGDEAEPAIADPFTSAGFGMAVQQMRDEAGSGTQLTRLFVNDVQTQFIVLSGENVDAYSVRADTGELDRQDATVTVSGNATLQDFAFALDGVDPAAVDRMLSAARKQSGASDFRPTVLSLERRIPFGERKLEWTINAQGNGRSLLFRANADGTQVRNEGGEGVKIPQGALDAQKLQDCIKQAGGDTDQILACFDEFQ
jgi:hypothetical protein